MIEESGPSLCSRRGIFVPRFDLKSRVLLFQLDQYYTLSLATDISSFFRYARLSNNTSEAPFDPRAPSTSRH